MHINMQIATVAANFLLNAHNGPKVILFKKREIKEKNKQTQEFKRVDRNCDELQRAPSQKIWVKSQHFILFLICVCILHTIFDCYSFEVAYKSSLPHLDLRVRFLSTGLMEIKLHFNAFILFALFRFYFIYFSMWIWNFGGWCCSHSLFDSHTAVDITTPNLQFLRSLCVY